MVHFRTCSRCHNDYRTVAPHSNVCDECSMSKYCINKRKERDARLLSKKTKDLNTN